MGHPLGVAVLETLTGDRVLTQAEVDATNIFTFDPDGARNLDLPAEADNAGIILFIANAASGAEIITIRDDGAGSEAPEEPEGYHDWLMGAEFAASEKGTEALGEYWQDSAGAFKGYLTKHNLPGWNKLKATAAATTKGGA